LSDAHKLRLRLAQARHACTNSELTPRRDDRISITGVQANMMLDRAREFVPDASPKDIEVVKINIRG
jgi:hypothetical protein